MTVAAGTVSKKILYKGCNFVDGIIDNYEKVASSKKTYQIQDQSAKSVPHKSDNPFMTKKAEKTYMYLLRPHIPIELMHIHIWVYPHWD